MIQKFLSQRKYLTKSPGQTKKIGMILAKKILKTKLKREKAFVLGLKGDLGGGKTTFLQGFAKGLGIRQKILSPTFIIIRRFKINNLTMKQLNNFYHIDCYRIKNPKEIFNLGFKKNILNPHNIVAIEWADRIRKILPKSVIFLDFEFVDKKTRKITVKYRG